MDRNRIILTWMLNTIFLFRGSSYSIRHSIRPRPRRHQRSMNQPLPTRASSTTMSTLSSSMPTVAEFVRQQTSTLWDTNDHKNFKNKYYHIYVGNPAGDADSIISAIGLAYVDESIENPSWRDDGENNNKKLIRLPVISIKKHELKTQRPETIWLLELAGIPTSQLVVVEDMNHPSILCCIDHPQLPEKADVTLVDHNHLQHHHQQQQSNWNVIEIVDHHMDLGHHSSVQGPQRTIAFRGDSESLVASTCTLVVERLLTRSKDIQTFPPTLSILLLGVILLDSVNMSPQAGKGTERDGHAIQALLDKTDWNPLVSSMDREGLLDNHSSHPRPDVNRFFEKLQSQKFNPHFWDSLSVSDALSLDYKAFTAPTTMTTTTPTTTTNVIFGVSTVLQSMESFRSKLPDPERFRTELQDFMTERGIHVLGIMFAVSNSEGQLTRQLLICSSSRTTATSTTTTTTTSTTTTNMTTWSGNSDPGRSDLAGSIVAHLQQPHYGLQLVERFDLPNPSTRTFQIIFLNQGKVTASRKQLVPILMDYWKPNDESKL